MLAPIGVRQRDARVLKVGLGCDRQVTPGVAFDIEIAGDAPLDAAVQGWDQGDQAFGLNGAAGSL